MTCRMIPLSKAPKRGVRPIGVGETLRRVMAKTVVVATGDQAMIACDSDQLCCGTKAGIEAAIHVQTEELNKLANNGGGLLLLDADNAFNALHRADALEEVRRNWKSASCFVAQTPTPATPDL